MTRKGFTLIESIVTLAITAMVVTLLMPAIFASRENAKKFSCTQHLHQLGVQGQVFVQSRGRGNFPALNMALAPNPDNTIQVAVSRRGDYAGGWTYFSPYSFKCPSDTQQGTIQIRNADDTYRTMVASYGYSIRMLYNGILWYDRAMGPPNEVAVFYDGSMSGPDSLAKNIEGNYLSTLDFALYSISFRHRNRYASVSFADAHVSTFDYFDTSYYKSFGSGNQPASNVVVPSSNPVGGSQGNNGHGNNIDGVDSSNPGKGKGGPGGGLDPSGSIDDEKLHKGV